jgi:hypothetical protein
MRDDGRDVGFLVCNGRRASFLGWCGVLAVVAVCGALLYVGLVNEWSRSGVPAWMAAYERWEKRQAYEWGLWWKYGAPTKGAGHAAARSIHSR